MIRTLIALRLKELLHAMGKRTKAGGKGKGMKILFAALMVYCAVVFLGMFGGMFYLMCEPFAQMNLSWLYFAFAGIMSVMLCFIGSIFFAQALIFEAKDNELLLSMPIKPSAILFSRVGTLLVLNLGSSLFITLPCIAVWIWQTGFSPALVLRYLVFMLALPLLPTALSCAVGYVVALISSRMRSKNLVSLVLTVALMAGYFYVCFNAQELLMKLLQNGEKLAAAIEKAARPFYTLGAATADGNALAGLEWLAWCILPMAVVYALLTRGFVRITTMKRGAKKVKYKAREARSASAVWALTCKEMRRYTANYMYVINGALGAVMGLMLAVVLLFKKDLIGTLLAMYAITGIDLNVWMGGIVCALLCLMSAMNMLSAASVSIEGKNLWLMQSLPLKVGDILLPKALAHMVICLPLTVISGVVMACAIEADIITALAVIVLPVLVGIFQALFGVVMNLLMNRFDYANDVVAIKSSMASGITMFAGVGVVALPVILYAVVLKASFALSYLYPACGIVLALGCFLMYYYLTHGAQKRFDMLGQG